MRVTYALCVGLVAFLGIVPACSDGSSARKPIQTAQPTGEIKRVEKKTQVHKFEGYIFELPTRFKPVEASNTKLPRDIKTASFYSPAGIPEHKEPQESFVVARMPDGKAEAEMQKNPRQVLVNASAGFSDGQGLKVLQRGELRPQRIGNQIIFMMPMVWSNQEGGELLGFAAAAAGKDHFLNVFYMGFSGDHVENAQEIEACLGTFENEAK